MEEQLREKVVEYLSSLDSLSDEEDGLLQILSYDLNNFLSQDQINIMLQIWGTEFVQKGIVT